MHCLAHFWLDLLSLDCLSLAVESRIQHEGRPDVVEEASDHALRELRYSVVEHSDACAGIHLCRLELVLCALANYVILLRLIR